MEFGYFQSLLIGAATTIAISISAVVIAALLGLLLAFGKLSKVAIISLACTTYTTVIRGIPEFVLLLLIFFGGQIGINTLMEELGSDSYIDINPFITGVVTLGLIYAAYMAETFRGAILAMDVGQIEAGRAFAMPKSTLILRIIVPQLVQHALPGFTNNWLVLLKATALVSLIGLEDMVNVARYAGAATKQPFIYFFATAILYLIMTWCSLKLLNTWAKRFNLEQQRL